MENIPIILLFKSKLMLKQINRSGKQLNIIISIRISITNLNFIPLKNWENSIFLVFKGDNLLKQNYQGEVINFCLLSQLVQFVNVNCRSDFPF